MKKIESYNHKNVFIVENIDGKRFCVPYTQKLKTKILKCLSENSNIEFIFDNYSLVWTKSDGFRHYLWHEDDLYHDIEYVSIPRTNDALLFAFDVMSENGYNACVVGDKVITILNAEKYDSVKNFLETIDN